MSEPLTRARSLAGIVMLQMLPATLLTPAIRPLFALQHRGNESAMHAFMSLNMIGAAIAAPLVGALLDKRGLRRIALLLLCVADSLLLLTCTLPLPTPVVLAARTLEGAAHVGAATLLLSEAAHLSRQSADPRVMGAAGAAIMVAVASGNMLGALLVGIDRRAPFWAGALLALVVAALGRSSLREDIARPLSLVPMRQVVRPLLVPISSAFFARFTVGCLIVTFSLFAHRAHGLSDRAIGGLFSAMTVPFALATYPAAKLAQRVPRSLLLLGGVAVYALVLLSLGYVQPPGLVVGMVLGGVASACIFASTLGYSAELAPAGSTSRAMSLFNAAGCLGMLLGPAAAGVLSALVRRPDDPLHAYRLVFAMAACSLLVFLLLSAPWLLQRLRLETGSKAASQPLPSGNPQRND